MMSSRGGLKSAEQLQTDLQAKQSDPKHKAMQKQRNKLPAAEVAQHLVDLVANNQVVVISGETGCGKTTQCPQFLLDDAIKGGWGDYCRSAQHAACRLPACCVPLERQPCGCANHVCVPTVCVCQPCVHQPCVRQPCVCDPTVYVCRLCVCHVPTTYVPTFCVIQQCAVR